MAGSLYLGSQKVCPAIVFGSEQKDCLFRVPDNVTSITTASQFSYLFNDFPYPVSVDFNNVETISGASSFAFAFLGCTVPKLNLSSIKTINATNNVFQNAFNGATLNDVTFFENLETINCAGALRNMFNYSNLSGVIHFPKLKYITSSDGHPNATFETCFSNTNVTEIYFDVLTNRDLSPQYYYVFDDMLYGVDGCTVHFPSNLASTVGIYLEVVSGMGGTNTTVLFDLPASEE